MPLLLFSCPIFAQVLAYLTSDLAVHDGVDPKGGLSALLAHCFGAEGVGVAACSAEAFNVAQIAPSADAARFLIAFSAFGGGSSGKLVTVESFSGVTPLSYGLSKRAETTHEVAIVPASANCW